jgi:hypothetical protein
MTEPEGPADPVSSLAEGAAMAHELFLSYKKAGFSAEQALYIISRIITANIRPPDAGIS